MLDIVQHYNELSTTHYQLLWQNLKGMSEEELEWRPHPEANHCRWILGHLLWFEDWLPDALSSTGRYLTDRGPRSDDFEDLDELRKRFDVYAERRLAAYERLSEAALEDERDYFGAYRVDLLTLVRTHAGHMAGHRYQIRYIRGIYSRAHGTDKAVFDPW
jgi:hypothetical protein